MATLHDVGEHDRSSEDLERLPDGIPHVVIALTAFYAVVFAIALVVLLSGERISGVALLVVAVPLLVARLTRKAERERDPRHPSR
jgi:hypothetical protein